MKSTGMQKNIKYFISFVILAAILFGAGLGLAEIRMRYFLSQKITIIPKNTANVQPEEKTENITPLVEEEADVPEEPENIDGSTAPTETETFSFGVLGDSQYFNLANPNGGLQKAVRNLKKDNPALVFAMGDMISSCDDAGECTQKYSQWKSATSSFSGKIFAMQGNHDRTGKDKADGAWNAAFNFPKNGPNGFQNMAYSFNHGNTHFAVLDSDKPKEHIINGAQRSWLDQDLARNKKENTFVFFHEPAWPVGAKIGESLDVENSERNALWEIIARHRVTAVFSGHEHIFSRKNVNGVYQFVVGNTDSFDHTAPRAGMAEYAFVGLHYAVVSVTGKKINVKVYTVDGKMVNSFDFQK